MKFTISKSVIENIVASMQPFLSASTAGITNHIQYEMLEYRSIDIKNIQKEKIKQQRKLYK